MPNATGQKKKSRSPARDESADRAAPDRANSRSNGTRESAAPANGKREDTPADAGPSLSDRTASGMRLAQHLRKAAAGGNLRKGFSLWRASKELPTAAAGAADLFKRHPVPISLLGGALTTAGLLYAAYSMGAFDQDQPADDQQSEEDEEGSPDAQANSEDSASQEEADQDDESDEEE